MSIESIPSFTDSKKLLLANVWCSTCRDETTITNFTGAVKAGELLLIGLCSICRGDVGRVVKWGDRHGKWHQG